jgi:CheY-like chemotaxis protein
LRTASRLSAPDKIRPENGVELLARVRATRPDVAIVDIRMPPAHATEGLDAARVIRRELPETAVIVLSAHVEIDGQRRRPRSHRDHR